MVTRRRPVNRSKLRCAGQTDGEEKAQEGSRNRTHEGYFAVGRSNLSIVSFIVFSDSGAA